MLEIKDKSRCSGCFACAVKCPQNCITMQADNEGFLYPQIDKDNCVDCGLCEKVCPVQNQSAIEQDSTPKAYAAFNNDEAVRLKSSSGGVFSLIADAVLAENGVVFGAAMVDKNTVKHIEVTDKESLYKLMGSKYLQSQIGDSYTCAKSRLEQGVTVLFSGTPCQIEGLKSFLGKEYENLICLDLICHGVPSPMVWKKYVDYCEENSNSSVEKVNFRDKIVGWKTFSMSVELSNGSVYHKTLNEDIFMRAFLKNVCLRPSCYSCAFKKLNRVSDITLADFWGVQEVLPQMDDDKGTSLVILHSKIGEKIFKSIADSITYCEADTIKAISSNPAMCRSAALPKTRSAFMESIDSLPFDVLVKKYAKDKITLKRIIKKALKTVGLLDAVKKIVK